MIDSYNTSVLTSPVRCHLTKGLRSGKLNMYKIEVVDFDGDSHVYECEAESYAQVALSAEDFAAADGVQISYINIYLCER